MKTCRVLSALLCYPTEELAAALPELRAMLAAAEVLPAGVRRELDGFIGELQGMDLLDAQERYVGLFDRNRALSLHLYEHVHGESRDRGQAMVRLVTLYGLHGYEVSARELPDYLPLFLEFLSVLPDRAARSLLADAVHVIAALRRKLAERQCRYAAVLAAVEHLAGRTAPEQTVRDTMAVLDAGADRPEALDREWEDEAVRFAGAGPDAAASAVHCGR